MTVILTDVILPDTSGMPKDVVVNTFTLSADTLTPLAIATAAQAALVDFYNLSHGADPAVAAYIGASRDRGANKCQMKSYDVSAALGGGPHGSPVLVSGFTLNAPFVTDELPLEVALVLSFHSDLSGLLEHGPSASLPSSEAAIDQGAPATHTGNTRPKGRNRGRIYLGPLTYGATPGGDHVRPTNGPKNALKNAAVQLMSVLPAIPATQTSMWSVWSRRNASVTRVTGGWVDNAFDTVRRRGIDASAKLSWGV